jgi:hypothetical protein
MTHPRRTALWRWFRTHVWPYYRVWLALGLYALVPLRLWKSGWHSHALVSFGVATGILGLAWGDGSLRRLIAHLRPWLTRLWPFRCHVPAICLHCRVRLVALDDDAVLDDVSLRDYQRCPKCDTLWFVPARGERR